MNYLGVIGTHISIQTKGSQSIRLLGRMTIAHESRLATLRELKTRLGVDELVYLATCNRVEFIFSVDDSLVIKDIRNRILDFFFRENPDISFSPNDFYSHSGLEAGRHLFSVASAIDSLVVGEAQILGQVKDAYSFACENDLAGDKLASVFQRIFRVAKKVRTETDLGKRSVSMVSLAATLIQQVIVAEGDIPVSLVGVGEMTRKMAKYLRDKGIRDITFVNRTVEKAEKLASEFDGAFLGLDEFLSRPPQTRIICSATSSADPIFTEDSIEPLMSGNPRLLIIDLAIPCDVEIKKPVDNSLEIYNIADLKKISEQNRRQRFRDVDKARAIISDEVIRYHQTVVESELKPVFDISYQEAKSYAQRGLDQLFTKSLSHLSDGDKDKISHLVEKLVGYTTFLPARTLANRVAVANEGADAEATFGTDNQEDMRTFRKGA